MKEVPGHPDHPDWWLLLDVTIERDAQGENGQGIEDILARMIDPESATCAGIQRAQRIRPHAGLPHSVELMGVLTTLWLDGLLTGMRVQQRKMAPPQEEEEQQF